MTLGDFHNLVKTEAKKGSTLDDIIPNKVYQAVKELQRKYTFRLQERFVTMTISAAAQVPRAISQPLGYKAMKFWRIINTGSEAGTFTNIRQIDPEQVTSVDTDRPNGFWTDGADYFWLDNTPDVDYNTEMSYVQNSVVKGMALETVVPFLEEYEALVLNETMVQMGAIMRDDKLIARYISGRNVLLDSAIREDIEKRQSWSDERMQYGSNSR